MYIIYIGKKMEEEIVRPKIIEDGKWSKYVKGIIKSPEGEIIGVVMNTENNLIIEFFDEISPIIVFDKLNKKLKITYEKFPTDPKKFFKNLRW